MNPKLDIDENTENNNFDDKPPRYKKIKLNRFLTKLKPLKHSLEYIACDCRADHLNPCGLGSNCLNVDLHIECDPDLCPAKEKCQNQHFHRGAQYQFKVELTEKTVGVFL